MFPSLEQHESRLIPVEGRFPQCHSFSYKFKFLSGKSIKLLAQLDSYSQLVHPVVNLYATAYLNFPQFFAEVQEIQNDDLDVFVIFKVWLWVHVLWETEVNLQGY